MRRLFALMLCAMSLQVMGQEECNDISSFFDFADLYLEADQYSPDSINYFLVRLFPGGVGEYWQLDPTSTSGIFSFEYTLCEENGIVSYADSYLYEGQVNANGVFAGMTNDGASFTFSPIREGFPFDACSSSCNLVYDGNGDGFVGSGDLLGLLTEFGAECAPAPAFSCGDAVSYQGHDYETVLIGNQCWFAENLKSRFYQNGDMIPVIYEDSLWAHATEGASCWLDNDSVIHHYNGRGMFYNHFAVSDERMLCPSGWHVPSYHEFQTLFESVGGADFSGNALKSTLIETECWGITAGWYESEFVSPTDEFGFGMLATSGRGMNGGWEHPCNYGYEGWLWTNSVSHPNSPWFVRFSASFENAALIKEWYGEGPERGLPVRCIKD